MRLALRVLLAACLAVGASAEGLTDTEVTALRKLLGVLSVEDTQIPSTDGATTLLKVLKLSGASLQVVSDGVEGAGNVIIGDNLPAESAGSQRTGQHNLVVGDGHAYTGSSGVVVGEGNTISNGGVAFGKDNNATGAFSFAAGTKNVATGLASTVLGGSLNIASGEHASVSGGHQKASYTASSCCGLGYGDNEVKILELKDVRKNYFSSSMLQSGLENEDDPSANTYSVVGAVDSARYLHAGGYYQFKLRYVFADEGEAVFVWRQTSWLTERAVSGYEVIESPAGFEFNGLMRSHSPYSYLDGYDGPWWYHAVGCARNWQGGIPVGPHNPSALSEELYVYPAQIDCLVSEWSEWRPCSCFGETTRSRDILTPPHQGGEECPELSETDTCSPEPGACVVDCVVSEWQLWSPCSCSGEKSRVRQILTPPHQGGEECPELSETDTCSPEPGACVVDCVVSEWQLWSPCSCSGEKSRVRQIQTPPHQGGEECPELSETDTCSPEPGACVVDCVVSEWQLWSPCSCSGEKSRVRHILTPPHQGGEECPELSETDTCSPEPGACVVDCVVSEWQLWSPCSCSGEKSRVRHILTPPHQGGEECPELSETDTCSPEPGACVVDCVVSEWQLWSPCSCSGEKSRVRQIQTPPHQGGEECPELSETDTCSPEPGACVVDCVVSEWSEWGACTLPCGGVMTRSRSVHTSPQHGGEECPHLSETDPCTPCPEEPIPQ